MALSLRAFAADGRKVASNPFCARGARKRPQSHFCAFGKGQDSGCILVLMNETNPTFIGANVEVARDFTLHLTDLLRKENGALVNFLLALAECDGRRLWAELGYASLFDYLHRELKLSKSSAWDRAASAGLIVRYPAITDALADGRLCVSTLGEIRKVIAPNNAAAILPRFFHCSAREAKEIAAAIAPAAASPRQDLITKLRAVPRTIPTRADLSAIDAVPTPEPKPIPGVQTSEPGPAARSSTRANTDAPVIPEPDVSRMSESSAASALRLVAPPPREEVRPLTAELRRLHVTVTKQWVAKLDAAKEALSHSIPSGSAEAVLEAALDALLEREAKRKGLTAKARAARVSISEKAEQGGATEQAQAPAARMQPAEGTHMTSAPPSPAQHRRSIPAHVRRDVLRRDGARCQARLHDGSVCGSTTRVQFDHVTPVALGGVSTVDNVRCLCERPEVSPRSQRESLMRSIV